MKKFISLFILFLSPLLSNGVTDFGLDLLQTTSTPQKNTLLSPYSISRCLSMVSSGAKKETLKELKRVLYLTDEMPYIEDSHLHEASTLWISPHFFVLPQFQASIQRIELNAPENAAHIMNTWIAEKTEQKIKNLISPSDLSPFSKLILINALHFKGEFFHPFSASRTKSHLFWVDDKAYVPTPMMNKTAHQSYSEDNLFKVVSFPFIDSNISLVIFLPKERIFSDLATYLNPERFELLLDNLYTKNVQVKIPKFKIQDRYDLIPLLRSLGLSLPFSQKADFSGITGEKNLYLSHVLHGAFFELSEKGVTAAAATASVMNVTSCFQEEYPLEFRADHPFIFALVDMETKTPLFLGEFYKPDENSFR